MLFDSKKKVKWKYMACSCRYDKMVGVNVVHIVYWLHVCCKYRFIFWFMHFNIRTHASSAKQTIYDAKKNAIQSRKMDFLLSFMVWLQFVLPFCLLINFASIYGVCWLKRETLQKFHRNDLCGVDKNLIWWTYNHEGIYGI